MVQRLEQYTHNVLVIGLNPILPTTQLNINMKHKNTNIKEVEVLTNCSLGGILIYHIEIREDYSIFLTEEELNHAIELIKKTKSSMKC